MSSPSPLLLPEARDLAARLAEPRWGPYPRPHYDGFSVPNVAATALKSLTGAPPPSGSRLPPLASVYPRTEGAQTVVVFLVDSFGWNVLSGLESHARTTTERAVASKVLPCAWPLTTVFPSTTSSALLSLSTGTAPGTHGVVGYTEYFPAWGTILNTLKMTPSWGGPRDLAAGQGFRPSDLLPVPTVFRATSPTLALTKEEFGGTAFTKALYDGAPFQGYISLSDLAMHLGTALGKPAAQRPRLIWAYWDLLDAVHHVHGPTQELATRELTHLFLAMASVASALTPEQREGVSFLVTGDHGQIAADPARAFPVHEDPALLSLLRRPPSGERRAAFLEAREGRRDDLERYLRARETDGWVTFTVREVIEGGLLGPGPHHPELADRLGDFLVLPPPGGALYYRPPGRRGPEEHFLRGAHGGLTVDELLVPLVSTTFDQMAGWDL